MVGVSESRINNNDISAFTALWTKNKNKYIWIENGKINIAKKI